MYKSYAAVALSSLVAWKSCNDGGLDIIMGEGAVHFQYTEWLTRVSAFKL